MKDLKQASALIQAAERDVSALRGMEDSDIFADEIFGFHVQQAVEKLLKAWLASLGETYPATHDLSRLVEMLKARDEEATFFDDLLEYTAFAVQFRYSASDRGSTTINRNATLRRVKTLLEAVRRKLAGMETL